MVGFHPDVAWTVERRGLSLVHRITGARLNLDYPEAALWDLLHRNAEPGKIVRVMAAITGRGPSSARTWIVTTVEGWITGGWLLKE
jgi:hypothetical protein